MSVNKEELRQDRSERLTQTAFSFWHGVNDCSCWEDPGIRMYFPLLHSADVCG